MTMLPVLPIGPLYIEHYCKMRHYGETLHEIHFLRYDIKKHTVVVKMMCIEFQRLLDEKGEGTLKFNQLTFSFDEWVNFLASYQWNTSPDQN